MAHQEAQALFAPMVDHELAPAQEAELKSHLEHCPECQHGFEKYSRAVTLVRSVSRERAPADFAQQVLKRVRKRRRWQGTQIFESVGMPAQAGIAVLIAAAIAAVVVLLLK
ncbi:MAG TPA: zf-HC2 domain-containing protein [Myxococcales bacterium]|jgi:anti-sigma factor RsiW